MRANTTTPDTAVSSRLTTARQRLSQRLTRRGVERICEFAFRLARRKVTCVDKANIFKSFAFFRKVFDEVAASHPDVASEHAYIDAQALYLVQRPRRFDVLVTENLFGDILSDLAAGLVGGMGMAPSADIGERHAVFQPAHGTAPDIAGQGIANPVAAILSAAMLLDWLGRRHGQPALGAVDPRPSRDGAGAGSKQWIGDRLRRLVAGRARRGGVHAGVDHTGIAGRSRQQTSCRFPASSRSD